MVNHKENTTMKTKIRILAAAVVMAAAVPCIHTAAQTDSVEYAIEILKGLHDGADAAKGIAILEDAAERRGDARAMNALGLAYMKGIGVEQDSTLCVGWMERAGASGYAEAYHNLGMMYKYANGGLRQNMAKAYRYFARGAEAGSVACWYDAGYMLYKGLGCRQDYAMAARWFRKGADKDHSLSLYMLGLCYRNGYGVERDTARASFYLGRAATLGYSAAIEELMRETPENSWNGLHAITASAVEVPATMPSVSPAPVSPAALPGRYAGTLVKYDWSGRHIISELPLTVDMTARGDTLTGKWCHGGDTVRFEAVVSHDGRLRFTRGAVCQHERYTDVGKVLYRFKHADLAVSGGCLAGALRLYSVTYQEPERPMYVCMRKEADATPADSVGASRLTAYPNPFSGQMTVEIDLPEPVADATVGLFSQAGMNVYSAKLGSLPAGRRSPSLRQFPTACMYSL